MLAVSNVISQPFSPVMSLLSEAHDHHLVTGHFGRDELLLSPGKFTRRSAPEQRAFRTLVDEKLVHECGRDGYESERCRSIYAPSNAGMQLLREIALSMDIEVELTEGRWGNQASQLCWGHAHQVWDTYQGSVYGRFVDISGRVTEEQVEVAEVAFHRFNGAVAKATVVELMTSINSMHELQNYGVFQGSCRVDRVFYAASFCCDCSRSGLSMTAPIGSQFRVWPDQRFGLRARAC